MNINLYKLKKTAAYFKHYGVKKMAQKAYGKLVDRDDYSQRFKELIPTEKELLFQRSRWFEKRPLISILVPVYNPPGEYFKEMLLSVINQTYFNWQLCLVDAGTQKQKDFIDELARGDERICYRSIENGMIAANTNEALAMAEGEYIALLDNDDTLSLEALYRMVEKINEEEADCLYSDEDKMDETGEKHFCPHIKPDYNPVLLQSNNYICHLFMVKTELARKVGGFSTEYDGAQDYDFILKCTEMAAKVSHVPRILYNWRTHSGSTSSNPLSKMYAYEAGKKAVEAHLTRLGKKGTVSMLEDMGFYRVDYSVDGGRPKVQVVVLGVRSNEQAQEYFSYLRENTAYDNMSLCAMNEADADRLKQQECEYFCVLSYGMKVPDSQWLDRLAGCVATERADAVAAKVLVSQPFALWDAVIRRFIAYSGDDYRDAFGKIHINAGKPAWYRGFFNRILLQSCISTIPRTGVLICKDVFIELVRQQWDMKGMDLEKYMFVYEPAVELTKESTRQNEG